MCVRYACTCDHEEIEHELQIPGINTAKDHPRENVGPRSNNPVVRLDNNQLILDYLEWGLNPAANMSTFNCRIESIKELKPTWKCAKTKRAVAIMNGYYEWQHKAVDKTPFYFHTQQGITMALAIWDNNSYSIVTKNATKKLAKIHPRMPILVDFSVAQKWIKGEWPAVLDLVDNGIEPEFYQVSQRVNKVENQGPDLLKEVRFINLSSWAKSGTTPKEYENKSAKRSSEAKESSQESNRQKNNLSKQSAEYDGSEVSQSKRTRTVSEALG